MEACDSKVLVKDIKRSKVIVGRAECLLVCHTVFGRSECLADEDRTPFGVPAAFFLELMWNGIWTVRTRPY